MSSTTFLANIENEIIPVIAIAGGIVIAAVAILGGIAKSISDNKQREETKREISAYVAEGSITADEGERLIKAGKKHT